MKSIKFLTIYFCLVTLVGCVSQPSLVIKTPIPESSPVALLTEINTPLGVATNPPTLSATFVNTETPVTVSKATMTPMQSVITEFCPAVDATSSFPVLEGVVVLGGDNIVFPKATEIEKQPGLFFWDDTANAGSFYALSESESVFYYATSPDKSRIALTRAKTLSKDEKVIVLSKDGKKEGSFVLPENWTLFEWLDNKKLLVRQERVLREQIGLVAIEPVSGTRQFLPFQFPDIYDREPFFLWGASTIFDSTLSFVVYPIYKNSEMHYVLWDINKAKQIASVKESGHSFWPKWSPDSKQVAVVQNTKEMYGELNEIYLLNTVGGVQQATAFQDVFPYTSIHIPVWSPDGRYLAFLMSNSYPYDFARLVILDVQTGKLDLYCHTVDPYPQRGGDPMRLGYVDVQKNVSIPIWSPDGKYILLEDWQLQDGTSKTYLVDRENHQIWLFSSNARPAGWLK